MNVEAEFTDKTCTQVNFKSFKWKVPLAAIKAMQIEEKSGVFKLTITFDLPELEKIMREYGATKIKKKPQRAIKFVDRATLRDFVFHLKRLYHLKRRSKAAKDANMQWPPIQIALKK